MPRAILCILDSFGIGGAPDAADYGDVGANTSATSPSGAARAGQIATATYGPLSVPNLDALGLGAAGKLSTGTLPPRPDRPAQRRPLGRRPRGLARARTRPPATGKSPACRCPSTGAISPRPSRPSRPS